MRKLAVASGVAGLALAVFAGAGTASAQEMAPQHSVATVTPNDYTEVFGPYPTFAQCDSELTYVMGYTGYKSTTGCFLSRGGNSWLFKATFSGQRPG